MKKCLAVLVGVVALSLTSGAALAQAATSYDTVMAAPKPEKPVAGYDGGFFIQDPSGDFRLGLSPRVDTMFFWQSENVPDDVTTALNESLDQLSFRLRRAQFVITPSWKNFSALVLLGYGTGGGTYWVANATWEPNPYYWLEIGMEDPQYDLTSITSSKRFTMVDAPIVVTQQDGEQPVWSGIDDAQTIARPSFGLPTQLGIFTGGQYFNSRLKWSVSVGNGSEGADALNTNRQFQYTMRLYGILMGNNPYGDMTDLKYSETPSLGIGLGGALEHDDRKHATTFIKQFNWSFDGTADAVFKYRGLAVNFAGYYRQIKTGPGATIEAGEKYLTDVGYLAAIGFFVIPKKLEVQGWGAQTFREGPDNNLYEFGGGLNYYLRGHNAKFQVDFSRVIDYDDIVGLNNRARNRIRAKMQLYF